MPRSTLQQRIKPSRREEFIPSYELGSLFDDDDLTLKLMIAKYRLLMAFDRATYWAHGKKRGTDNFIIGVGDRQKDLVAHVEQNVLIGMRCGIVSASELPDFLGEKSSVLRKVARDAEKQLLAVRLAQLAADGEVWFNRHTPGTWNVSQRLMDDYQLDRQLTSEAKRIDSLLRRESLHHGGRLRVVH